MREVRNLTFLFCKISIRMDGRTTSSKGCNKEWLRRGYNLMDGTAILCRYPKSNGAPFSGSLMLVNILKFIGYYF
ncbi:unnamed protein product [Cylicocyclus nassatus]|uniref:Uncharacterized protein n=1 Tax=Cylicocyclus nassatus TaxID=53992 RepID=A0AA36H7C0_CYLNA|nr:unnamed protein product [Cylicocyclus nassatus]